MTIVTWRNTAIVLAALCCYQHWQRCTPAAAPTRPAPLTTMSPEPAGAETRPTAIPIRSDGPSLDEPVTDAVAGSGKSFHGFKVPAWAMRLAPQRGETTRAYRDRILPLAEMAVAPQRARVARSRDDFANLDPHQRAELDAAVVEAAKAIQDRITAALAGGELRPATLKPMAGLAVARDVLTIVDRGNTRFLNTLTPDQRTRLASHRFDFADYLVFTAHWEDALHVLD